MKGVDVTGLFSHCYKALNRATRYHGIAAMLADFVGWTTSGMENGKVLKHGRKTLRDIGCSGPEIGRILTKVCDLGIVSEEGRIDVGRICALCKTRNLGAGKQVQSPDPRTLPGALGNDLRKLTQKDWDHLKGEFGQPEALRAIKQPEVVRDIQKGLSGRSLFLRLWKICEDNQGAAVSGSSAGSTSDPRGFCLRFARVENHWTSKMKGEPLSPAAEESLRLALGQYTARQLNDMIDFYCSRHPGRKDSLMFMAALACYREYMNAWGRYVKAYPQRSQLQPEEVKGWQLFQ